MPCGVSFKLFSFLTDNLIHPITSSIDVTIINIHININNITQKDNIAECCSIAIV